MVDDFDPDRLGYHSKHEELLSQHPVMKYPQHLLKLLENLKKLPGVGARSAERFAFQMLGWKNEELQEFAQLIKEIPEKLSACGECGCLYDLNACQFCSEAKMDSGLLCVIATAKDAYAIAGTREYKGAYHVLGALLSPLEGIGPEKLNLGKLVQRIDRLSIKEIILALDSTLEGDATALLIKKQLAERPIKISRLAFGIPMGSSFDYVDGGTLARALSGRGDF